MPGTDEFVRRQSPGAALAEDAALLTAAGRNMAARFSAGATLMAFGNGAAATDAQHIAVEFVHPVIVGKRALPALALGSTAPAAQLRQLARPIDIALGLSHTGLDPGVRGALDAAREMGLLTIALIGGGGPVNVGDIDHVLSARSEDPLIARELEVTTYHLLWELVHVFLDVVENEHCSTNGHCVTCSDEGVEVRVLELRPGGMALVDTGSTHEEVSVALVEARVGSRILVHAGEAIAALDGER